MLVCTHNDADHANGIIGFLEAGLGCNEGWLPASWTDRLEDLLLRPGDFIGELVENVRGLDEGITRDRETEGVSLEQLGDIRAAEGPSDEPREPVELDALLTRTLEATIEDDTGPRPWLYALASPFRFDAELFRHWLPDNRTISVSDCSSKLLRLESGSAKLHRWPTTGVVRFGGSNTQFQVRRGEGKESLFQSMRGKFSEYQ